MTLRLRGLRVCLRGQALPSDAWPDKSAVTGKVLVLIHGLCLNDLHWQTATSDGNTAQGEALAATLGYTPVYLRYNSGLHVSENGNELSMQLEQLAAHWPVAIEEISILAHSMGGLLARSAEH